MSTELTIQDPKILAEADATAENLSQVPGMQASLLRWAKEKADLTRAESKELWDSFEYAKAHKWKKDVIKKHADLADKRVLYYEKLVDALEAGFCVFPTIDCDLFAIRTDKESPKRRSQFFSYGHPSWEESSDILGSGEGEYVNPVPPKKSYAASESRPTKENPQNRISGRTHYALTNFDVVQFPLSMCKPHIMDAVGKAMALKIFDEIGIIGDKATSQATVYRRRDPLIVGRILNPKRRGYQNGKEDAVTFLISWHVNTKDLEV